MQGEGATAYHKCPVVHLADQGGGGVRGEEDGKQEQQACNLIVKGERKKSLGEGRRRREQRNREAYEGREGGQQ